MWIKRRSGREGRMGKCGGGWWMVGGDSERGVREGEGGREGGG